MYVPSLATYKYIADSGQNTFCLLCMQTFTSVFTVTYISTEVIWFSLMIPIYDAFLSSATANTCSSNLICSTQVRYSALGFNVKYVCAYLLVSKILYLCDTVGLGGKRLISPFLSVLFNMLLESGHLTEIWEVHLTEHINVTGWECFAKIDCCNTYRHYEITILLKFYV